MKIAILYIGIGRYIKFLEGFYESCEKYFLPGEIKHYFLFTDHSDFKPQERQHVFFQEDLGWPGNTLFRFRFFQKCRSELQDYDYVFFFNDNAQFRQPIFPEEILPNENESFLTGLSWSHIYTDKMRFPYDRNPLSNAYIPMGEGHFYYQGGFLGGRKEEFLLLLDTLEQKIEDDYSKGIIALNHDESHINHYFLNKNIKVLDAVYGRPEEYSFPEKPKIIFRDKNKLLGKSYINKMKKRGLIKNLRTCIKKFFKGS